MRKPAIAIVSLAMALALAGCSEEARTVETAAQSTATSVASGQTGAGGPASTATPGESGTVIASYSEALTVAYGDDDLDASWDQSKASLITLAGGQIRFDGVGASVSGSKITIAKAGTYVVTGKAGDAQILIDCKDVGLVRLVLNGADITSSSGAPIYAKQAEKVVLILADGTQNTVADGGDYTYDDDSSDEPNAAVFSDTDLTINGGGSLTVSANYNDGITSKDDLKIVGGTLTINAANDAVNGKDSLGVKDALITVSAKGDGLQSTNDTSADKGFICISGGSFNISAGSDGVQATTTLLITAGDFAITTGGGSENGKPHQSALGGMRGTAPGAGRDRGAWSTTTESSTTTVGATAANAAGEEPLAEPDNESSSSKGLKADGGVFVQGGTFSLDCADDTLHSNGTVKVSGGTFTLASGDDAVHADVSIAISGGDFAISTCYEGIESNVIDIADGTIILKASDDGINGVDLPTAAAPTDSTTTTARAGRGMGGGMPGETGNSRLRISGGYLALDAGGDGIDINGTVEMTAGTVVINGPTNNLNGALDYLSELKVTGGLLIAVGSAGMAEAPTEASTQYSIMVNFDETQAAGTIVRVEDETGTPVLTMAPSKKYRSIVLSSPDLKQGATYTVYLGGSMTGVARDTVYSEGTYSGGLECAKLTLDSVVTTSGVTGTIGGGGFPGGGDYDGSWGGDGTQPSPPGMPEGGGSPPAGGGP